MANPRTGMYDPLNPLGLHSENRYRSPVYSMGAETEVYEAGLGALARLGGRGAVKGTKAVGKYSWKGLKLGGRGVKGAYKGIKNMRAKKLADDAAKGGAKGASDGIQKTFTKVGVGTGAAIGIAVGGVVFATLVGLGASDAIEAFTVNYTGANCADKAADRGLTEGSDEYEQAVKDCQQTAMNKLQFLSFGLIGGVGLVGFLIVKKYLPKGSKEEPKEEPKEESKEE